MSVGETPALPAEEHHIAVGRTARFYVAGAGPAARELWFALHGYGQLALRFLRSLAPVMDGRRVIVAPEGLSRFYVDAAMREVVGASWMTREDRLAEIDDYLAYLEAVRSEVRSTTPPDARRVVFGFSQGVATAVRWVTRGDVEPASVILWGGDLPPDADLTAPGLRHATVTLVCGRGDRYVTEKILARDEARLREAGVRYDIVRFEGGHEIVPEVLARVARA